MRVWVSAFCGITVLVAAGCANPLADFAGDVIESEPSEPQRSSGEQTDSSGSDDTAVSTDATAGPTDTAPAAETDPADELDPIDQTDAPASAPVMWAVSHESGVASELWRVSESGEELIGSVSNESGRDLLLADIAMSSSGELYAMDFNDLFLIDTFDSDSIIATYVGTHGINGGNALAFSDDGELFAAGTQGLFQIDPTTGQSSPIPTFDQFASSGDLAAGANGLYGTVNLASQATADGDVLVQLDLSTDSMLEVADLPDNVWALAFAGDRLYGMRVTSDDDCPGELLSIEPSSGSAVVVRCLPFRPGGAAATRP